MAWPGAGPLWLNQAGAEEQEAWLVLGREAGDTPVGPGPTSQPSRMKGRISSGFNSDSSRGRSTWRSWTWGGSWGGLEGRSPWALRNQQLRGVGRQGSCEEVLVQEGLRVASKGQQKETGHFPVPASATSLRGGDVNIALERIFPSSAHHSGDSNTSECSLFAHCSRDRRCSGKQNKELCLQVFHIVRGGGNKHDKEVRQTVHQMISDVGKRKYEGGMRNTGGAAGLKNGEGRPLGGGAQAET